MKHLEECPICGDWITSLIDGDCAGERVLYYCCVTCDTVFYPGWREQCWEDPDTRPIPHQLADYQEEDDQAELFPAAFSRLRERVPRAVAAALICLAASVAIVYFALHDQVRQVLEHR